jgi:hypothetical protein
MQTVRHGRRREAASTAQTHSSGDALPLPNLPLPKRTATRNGSKATVADATPSSAAARNSRRFCLPSSRRNRPKELLLVIGFTLPSITRLFALSVASGK